VDAVLDRTILGDCFEILPLLPRGFADLLIVDPPYNLAKDFHGSRFARMDDAEYEAYTRRWLEAALPMLKPDASVYVCCDWRSSLVIGRVLADMLTVRNRITWQREKGRGAKKNWKNAMEDIWFATCGKDYTFHVDAVMQRRRVIAPYRDASGAPKDWEDSEDGAFRNTHPSNFWDDISVPYWSMAENTAHPTQKPEKLMAKLILASSKRGDVVFDPFLGSGTTSVVAKKLGRIYCGVEINEEYCLLAAKRLRMVRKDKTIQGYRDGIFWERNTLRVQRKRQLKNDKKHKIR
jgi:site-specific DNA-methyltransferase (adenine-specific)